MSACCPWARESKSFQHLSPVCVPSRGESENKGGIGLTLYSDMAHSQNEKLDRRNYIEGTKLLGHYLFELSKVVV